MTPTLQDLRNPFPWSEMMPLQTVQDLFEWAVQALSFLDPVEARSNVEWMLQELLGTSRSAMCFEGKREISEVQRQTFQSWVARRIKREPLAYILRHAYFWNEKLEVGPGCLIPRPETERLVETAAQKIQNLDRPAFFCDIGTGTGAIAIALLRQLPKARAVLADVSSEALHYAQSNVRRYHLEHRTEIIFSDLFRSVEPGRLFDLVVSNPPYLSEADWSEIQPELLWEPRTALDGARDGLSFYRLLVQAGLTRIHFGGWLMMELGIHQSEPVRQMIEIVGGYQRIEIIKDYQGIDRVIAAQRARF